jgi:DNA repair protein RecO (recombination protein O)
MEWSDQGIVLAARPHGETGMIVTLLTPAHGRHAGLVAGGQSRNWHGVLQPGNLVQTRWRARLPDHLGNFTLDLTKTHAAAWLDTPLALAVIAAACAVTEAALPERQPMPQIFDALLALLALDDAVLWGPAYVQWEIGLLAALGYGLDLSCCAVHGDTNDLTHVSPRTGRAVSALAAAPYADRLLALPRFLTATATDTDFQAQDVAQGLALTGYFLARHVFVQMPNKTAAVFTGTRAGELPKARQHLADLAARLAQDQHDIAVTSTANLARA